MTRLRDDGREERIVRAKWTIDGAETVEEMAQLLEEKAESIRELGEEGWELDQTVDDDYAYLSRPAPEE